MLAEALSSGAQTRRRVLSIQSHVVHGYVGNKSAIFPLQLLGFDVDPINSVQFSNHTGYPSFSGDILKPDQLWSLFEKLPQLQVKYSHVLTGYIGSRQFLETVGKIVAELRQNAPELIYVCDPVLGDNGKFYAPKDLVSAFQDTILPLATILTPNQFECEQLTGMKIETLQDACACCDRLHELGPPHVFVTSLDIFAESEGVITMLYSSKSPVVIEQNLEESEGDENKAESELSSTAVSPGNKYLLKLPLLHFAAAASPSRKSSTHSHLVPGEQQSSGVVAEKEPPTTGTGFTGTGDLTAALLLARTFEHPCELPKALELVGASMQAVLEETAMRGRPRRLSVCSSSNFGPAARKSFSASETAKLEAPGAPPAPAASSPKVGPTSGAAPPPVSKKLVPPEIRLIQSKAQLERPTVVHYCRRIGQNLGIKAVAFDMDGTLTLPHQIDFKKLRTMIDAPRDSDILGYVKSIESEEKRRTLTETIEAVELAGKYELQPGIVEVLKELKKKGYKLGLITRNHLGGVEVFLKELEKKWNSSCTAALPDIRVVAPAGSGLTTTGGYGYPEDGAGLGHPDAGCGRTSTVAISSGLSSVTSSAGGGPSPPESACPVDPRESADSGSFSIPTSAAGATGNGHAKEHDKNAGGGPNASQHDSFPFKIFDGIRTRDSPVAPKPSGEAIRDLCEKVFGCDPEEVLIVGDHVDDVRCGEDVGAWTCEIFEGPIPHCGADFKISSLSGLLRFL
ncbi:unnamed protein product [Amoebophrya sp. A120]|nr:unnamed protein product [Amoebophrya sp. A120]|eukprot:GSA120T00011882001.1